MTAKKKKLSESKNSAFEPAVKKSTNTNFEENDDDLNKSGSEMEVNTTTYSIKITILGSSSVGKTSIIKRYIQNEFETSTEATIVGTYHVKKIKIDPFTEANLQIWDTAGQELYRSLAKNYLRDSKGVLIVFDLTNEKSFEELDSWLEDINNTVSENVPKILVGNKSDLQEKVISDEKASKYAEEHKMKYQIVSAKSGINIELLFETVGNECVKAIQDEQKELEEEEENENKGRPTGLSGQFETNVNNEKVLLSQNNEETEEKKIKNVVK